MSASNSCASRRARSQSIAEVGEAVSEYDRTWDEYAVLSGSANRIAVDKAYARAVQGDIHLDPCLFARLVVDQTPAAGLTTEASGVEL